MNKTMYGLLAAATLVGVSAVPAHATGERGTATAAVLRADLDVSAGGASLPLNVELNAVRAPESVKERLLEARLDGVNGGKPFTMLTADAATSEATVTAEKARGYSNLAEAEVYLPGMAKTRKLPGVRPFVKVEAVTSEAVCEAGAEPTADSLFVGKVKVLGKKVEVKAGGTATVRTDLGKVHLRMAETVTTSGTAAATALTLDVAVDPGKLGVTKVKGKVTLVEAACTTPGSGGGDNGGAQNGGSTGSDGGANSGTTGGGTGSDGGSTGGGETGGSEGTTGGETAGATGSAGSEGGSDGASTGSAGSESGGEGNKPEPQTGSDQGKDKLDGNLAETGGSSATPYLAGGALLLVAAGGALVLARRRRGGA
ncbi:SCO1860 family LAETG-anchored protein [Streptomyces sp. TRM 70361]|uniref:SCO1860 family LAETG-anchored protein n=1 Tax=Streptomyces sp. TRM 70361 TaxID=3116553 RepID=UPI002E7C1C78|nr:SCO1860 family LAETG-anchored protein [Streptomyces sp. TRM 70361]MEE1941559.1 SCO1860 family LAETG-anchored protein [Streptomyces sp. TRM 70361]